MIRQLIFGDKKSFTDFDMRIVGVPKTPPPAKRENTVTIPFTDGSFDQNKLVNYFECRIMTYDLFIKAENRIALEYKVMKAIRWLMTTLRGDIYDTVYMRYHYSGKCISIDSIEYDEFLPVCTITATFTADPYRLSGNFAYEEWDSFDFENGYLNEIQTYSAGATSDEWVSYTVYIVGSEFSTTTNITYIPSQAGETNEIKIKLRGVIYTFSANTQTTFKKAINFLSGTNEIQICGQGSVQFDTRERVL